MMRRFKLVLVICKIFIIKGFRDIHSSQGVNGPVR